MAKGRGTVINDLYIAFARLVPGSFGRTLERMAERVMPPASTPRFPSLAVQHTKGDVTSEVTRVTGILQAQIATVTAAQAATRHPIKSVLLSYRLRHLQAAKTKVQNAATSSDPNFWDVRTAAGSYGRVQVAGSTTPVGAEIIAGKTIPSPLSTTPTQQQIASVANLGNSPGEELQRSILAMRQNGHANQIPLLDFGVSYWGGKGQIMGFKWNFHLSQLPLIGSLFPKQYLAFPVDGIKLASGQTVDYNTFMTLGRRTQGTFNTLRVWADGTAKWVERPLTVGQFRYQFARHGAGGTGLVSLPYFSAYKNATFPHAPDLQTAMKDINVVRTQTSVFERWIEAARAWRHAGRLDPYTWTWNLPTHAAIAPVVAAAQVPGVMQTLNSQLGRRAIGIGSSVLMVGGVASKALDVGFVNFPFMRDVAAPIHYTGAPARALVEDIAIPAGIRMVNRVYDGYNNGGLSAVKGVGMAVGDLWTLAPRAMYGDPFTGKMGFFGSTAARWRAIESGIHGPASGSSTLENIFPSLPGSKRIVPQQAPAAAPPAALPQAAPQSVPAPQPVQVVPPAQRLNSLKTDFLTALNSDDSQAIDKIMAKRRVLLAQIHGSQFNQAIGRSNKSASEVRPAQQSLMNAARNGNAHSVADFLANPDLTEADFGLARITLQRGSAAPAAPAVKKAAAPSRPAAPNPAAQQQAAAAKAAPAPAG